MFSHVVGDPQLEMTGAKPVVNLEVEDDVERGVGRNSLGGLSSVTAYDRHCVVFECSV